MPVDVRRNPFHPTRDVAVLTEPWSADDLRAAADGNPRPLALKAVVGTDEHRRALAAGAVSYQQCPALEVEVDDAVARWAASHATLPVDSAAGTDLTELWSTYYEVVHRGWSPTAPLEDLKELFTDLVREINPERSVICTVDGEIVAAAFVFDDDPPEVCTEALLPEHPSAREAVGSCMAAVLGAASGEMYFDGHVGDPHFFPLWQEVPGVHYGDGDPLDLLEIRPRSQPCTDA